MCSAPCMKNVGKEYYSRLDSLQKSVLDLAFSLRCTGRSVFAKAERPVLTNILRSALDFAYKAKVGNGRSRVVGDNLKSGVEYVARNLRGIDVDGYCG